MFATVRNRRGVVASVEPFDADGGRLHLVHLEYKDDELPTEERLLWELEPRRALLEPNALPSASRSDPMPGEDFDAILRAARWTAATPFLDPAATGPLDRLPIQSPFHGAVQIEDFQLVPLLKALRMPRVNLLIADDVGLGKTIEAGLILTELLLRRRIQRVLILTPASLRLQWRDEMWDKFSLPFNLIDRAETSRLRRELGMDANPWRSFSRSIASYHYLRQPDVLDQFLAASQSPPGSAHLPWDLLIVDECHNLMPSAFGEDSDLCRMLRLIAPQFEHRLFLSATPHNGHTRSFSGLLEILDPVRFSQTDELKPAEKARIQQVVLRRLKREINARTNPPKFCHRNPPKPLLLPLSKAETSLSEAFAAFRTAIHKVTAKRDAKGRRSGGFAVEILGKRLLSCPLAFAESWRRCKQGLREAAPVADAEVDAARRTVERETDDDREAQSREATAATVVGAWLKSVAGELQDEILALDRAVAGLALDSEASDLTEQDPVSDARFDSLCALVDELLRDGKGWRADERLVVFTEYKTTLDYLTRRLHTQHDPECILTLFGGMDETERDLVKQAFNDPASRVRILIATDAASEGLNLQRTARYLLHFDCPWNPSKLEQRNGRIDRHGQARDVTVHYFMTDQDQDLRFLAHVIGKADEIREDLGSANELFDEAAHRRLVDGESATAVQQDLDLRIQATRGRATMPADDTIATDQEADGVGASQQMEALAAEFDLDPLTLRATLEAALAIRVGRPQLEDSEDDHTTKLLNPGLPGWVEVIDESLRRNVGKNQRGPVARLAFDNRPFLTWIGERETFCPRPDVLRMHLSHPMLQRALSTLTRRRYPNSGDEVSRWTVRLADLPAGIDAMILLSAEELAVNELRETFHHWVRTVAFPITKGTLGAPLPHRPARDLAFARPTHEPRHLIKARDVLEEVEPAIKQFLASHAQHLSAGLRAALTEAGVEAKRREQERYKSRQGEISALIAESTIEKLEREIGKLKGERLKGYLFDGARWLDEIDRSIEQKQEELKRRRSHYEEVRGQLEAERARVLERLLPRRHAMPGDAQVFPVTLEVRLHGGAR
jgi:superfamily II DNA or RNA helicase